MIKDSVSENSTQVSQGVVAIALPITLLTAAILHRRHRAKKRRQQIAFLERLWQRSPNDTLR